MWDVVAVTATDAPAAPTATGRITPSRPLRTPTNASTTNDANPKGNMSRWRCHTWAAYLMFSSGRKYLTMERSSTCRRMALIVGAALASLTLTSCSPGLSIESGSDGEVARIFTIEDWQRTYALSTTGCGHASAIEGTGVALGHGQILTAAHVVLGSSSIDVTTPGDARYSGRVVAIDVRRDLALIQISDDELDPVDFATAAVGDEAVVETRTASVIVSVAKTVLLDMAELGGSERSERRGIRLDGTTASGDSGSGLFTAEGLVGLVFATTTDDEAVTWATASSEIETFLAGVSPQNYSCDASESELIASSE